MNVITFTVHNWHIYRLHQHLWLYIKNNHTVNLIVTVCQETQYANQRTNVVHFTVVRRQYGLFSTYRNCVFLQFDMASEGKTTVCVTSVLSRKCYIIASLNVVNLTGQLMINYSFQFHQGAPLSSWGQITKHTEYIPPEKSNLHPVKCIVLWDLG